MKQTLLIIDVQKFMFEYAGGVSKGAEVLKNIKGLLNQAREAGTPVVFIQHTETEGEFAVGAPTWEIHSEIKPMDGEKIVQKNYWDSFMETELKAVLDDIGTEQLIICGMQTEYCVDTTVRSAFAKGYRNNILIGDGHTTFDTSYAPAETIIQHHNTIHKGRFAKVVTSDAIIFS